VELLKSVLPKLAEKEYFPCNIHSVDSEDLDEQREVLTELTYYGLALKGMDVEVPILVIDNDDESGSAFSFTHETFHGQDVITKLKEIV
jgi:hypothetical protein